MNEDSKIFQCPICIKGKYKESALIQHLIDKHPEYPASKNIRNNYQFPMNCPICSQKMTSPVAFMTHYSLYHVREYEGIKSVLGFDFFNPNVEFDPSQPLDIIPNLSPIQVYVISSTDTNFYNTFSSLVLNSPIMYSVLMSSNVLFICSNNGIVLVNVFTQNLGNFFNIYINGKAPVISFVTPTEENFLLRNQITIPHNVKTDPFACTKYTQFVRMFGPPIQSNEEVPINIDSGKVSKADLKAVLVNTALAYSYLVTLGYFPSKSQMPNSSSMKESMICCPCCDVSSISRLSIYRHLFRMHQFPAMIMNQYKMADLPKGKFACDNCHEQNINSFDDLMIHVYNEHREELLTKTKNYIDMHKNILDESPKLRAFVESELMNYGKKF